MDRDEALRLLEGCQEGGKDRKRRGDHEQAMTVPESDSKRIEVLERAVEKLDRTVKTLKVNMTLVACTLVIMVLLLGLQFLR